MEALVTQIANRHAATEGGLLPCLHEIQAELGFVAADSLTIIANAFAQMGVSTHRKSR